MEIFIKCIYGNISHFVKYFFSLLDQLPFTSYSGWSAPSCFFLNGALFLFPMSFTVIDPKSLIAQFNDSDTFYSCSATAFFIVQAIRIYVHFSETTFLVSFTLYFMWSWVNDSLIWHYKTENCATETQEGTQICSVKWKFIFPSFLSVFLFSFLTQHCITSYTSHSTA